MTTTLKPRTSTVTLYQGDDEDHLQHLADAVNDAQERYDQARKDADRDDLPPIGMMDEDPVAAAQERLDAAKKAHDEFLAEAEERAIKVVVQALGRKKFRDLADDHPPREDNEGDKVLGINDETFKEVFVPMSIISPTFDTTAERDDFLDSLALSQFRSVYLRAFTLNTVPGSDPKALTDSAPSRSESATQH